MTIRNQSLAALSIVTALVFSLIVIFMLSPRNVAASSPSGLNAQVATTSTLAVGPQNNMYAMGTTTRESAYQCASRIISTTAKPIMISFASLSSTTLSQTVGFQQAASTTESYDGGEFGCGYMTIRGLDASTTITIAETH